MEKKDTFGGNPKITRAGIYARVSTDEQSTEMQLDDLRRYCQMKRWKIIAEFDETASGAKDDRPKRKELINLCKEGKIDVILVWKLDRWGRSMVDLVNTLRDMRSLGIGFVSFSEHLDFTTSTGQLMADILSAFADFERAVIKERMWAGRQRYKTKHGNLGGRKPTAMAKSKEVIMLSEAGMSKYEIAKRLSIGQTSVARILKAEGEINEHAKNKS